MLPKEDSPWFIMQISPCDSAHFFPVSAVCLLVTKVHISSLVARLQRAPVQLGCNGSQGKAVSFQEDELSDHFQPTTPLVLRRCPPTQHPEEAAPQRDLAKFSSWTDDNAARWALKLRQRASDPSQESELEMCMKHLSRSGLICQPSGHDAAENRKYWY